MSGELDHRRLPGAHAPLLDPEAARAWRETRAQLRRVWLKARSGLPLAPDELHLPRLDQDQLLDAIHVPESAPEVAVAIQARLDSATEASRAICELCGEPGVLMEGDFRVKTLCTRCALAEGLLPVEVSTWEGRG